MRENFEKPVEESGAAFAFAVLLLNILVFATAGGLIWMVQMIFTLNNSQFSLMLREIAAR